ncbi:ribose-5-phosphate isomerase [Haloimpatiens sp. FM7315]|uniref:ribose-5-phosphate isomerase n=1 Tax=Haloimpatiens sp. FM7315 TaxID=3298609 RepID=UPI00370C7926
MYMDKKYKVIIEAIYEVKSVKEEKILMEEKLKRILEDTNSKYLLYLFMKKHNCFYNEKIKSILDMKDRKKINTNIKKGKEKFLINKSFRETYFEIDNLIEKIIRNDKKII